MVWKSERQNQKRAKSSSQYWLMIVADDMPADEAITCSSSTPTHTHTHTHGSDVVPHDMHSLSPYRIVTQAFFKKLSL